MTKIAQRNDYGKALAKLAAENPKGTGVRIMR